MQTYWRVQRWLKSSYLPTGFLVFGFSSRFFFLWASLLTVTSAKIHRPNTHGRWLPCGRAKRQCWPPCREKESESRARNKLGDDNTKKNVSLKVWGRKSFTRPSCIEEWVMRAQYAVVIDGRRLRVVDFGLVARMSKRSWPFFFVCFFFFIFGTWSTTVKRKKQTKIRDRRSGTLVGFGKFGWATFFLSVFWKKRKKDGRL